MADKIAGMGKKFQDERWRVWGGMEYEKLEDMPDHLRAKAYNYLSGTDLKEELEFTTEKSKRLAYLGDYEGAKKLAVVADEIEALLAKGGDRHG